MGCGYGYLERVPSGPRQEPHHDNGHQEIQRQRENEDSQGSWPIKILLSDLFGLTSERHFAFSHEWEGGFLNRSCSPLIFRFINAVRAIIITRIAVIYDVYH